MHRESYLLSVRVLLLCVRDDGHKISCSKGCRSRGCIPRSTTSDHPPSRESTLERGSKTDRAPFKEWPLRNAAFKRVITNGSSRTWVPAQNTERGTLERRIRALIPPSPGFPFSDLPGQGFDSLNSGQYWSIDGNPLPSPEDFTSNWTHGNLSPSSCLDSPLPTQPNMILDPQSTPHSSPASNASALSHRHLTP